MWWCGYGGVFLFLIVLFGVFTLLSLFVFVCFVLYNQIIFPRSVGVTQVEHLKRKA